MLNSSIQKFPRRNPIEINIANKLKSNLIFQLELSLHWLGNIISDTLVTQFDFKNS